MLPNKFICYVLGYVFIISGLIKLIDPSRRGMFHELALPFPETLFFLVAMVEFLAGMLLVSRMYLHLAIPPLIFIMIGALFFAKVPILWTEGLLSFLFASRLDIVLLVLLVLLWQHVGKWKKV
ncbi:DoxX family protein [Oceanobacillus iheyensis]|uniref:DoxX family protein n=1 Tax=Oceanobacillus iheyensis TaxID=182710 RepID=UPI0036372D6D